MDNAGIEGIVRETETFDLSNPELSLHDGPNTNSVSQAAPVNPTMSSSGLSVWRVFYVLSTSYVESF